MDLLSVDKILVIALHKLGDNLQVTPIFKVLKAHYPTAAIHVLTEQRFAFPFLYNPLISQCHYFDRTRYSNGVITDPGQGKKEICPVILSLREEKFDLLINRQSSIEGAILASLIGAKEIRGLFMGSDRRTDIQDLFTRLLFAFLPHHRFSNPYNFVDYAINIAGQWSGERKLDLCFEEAPGRVALEQLAGLLPDKPVVACQPGSLSARRQWGVANFSRALLLLLERSSAQVLLLGSKEEGALLRGLKLSLPAHLQNRIFDTSARVSLDTLPGVLARCACLVTNDTGTMHMAAAVGCPVIALYFGESFVHETGPYGANHIVVAADMDCLPCPPGASCSRDETCKSRMTPEMVTHLILGRLGLASLKQPENFFTGVRVLTSGETVKQGEIRYFPLLPVPATQHDINRYTYALTIKRFLREDVSGLTEQLADEMRRGFTDMAEKINGPVDLNMAPLQAFSRTREEMEGLTEALKESFFELRSRMVP